MDWYIPGTKAGGPVRSIYSLCEVLKEYYSISIFTTNSDLGSDKEYEDIVSDTFFTLNEIEYYYFSKNKLSRSNLHEKIIEFNPAIIYLNSFWSYLFSISVIRAKKEKKINAKIILAPRGMLSSGALNLKSFKKKIFLFISKLSSLYSGITFHASNLIEEDFIKIHFPKAKIYSIQNINCGKPLVKNRIKIEQELNLFYLSRIDRVKNLHFALEILKSLPNNIKITYDIFGNKENVTYWNECEQIINSMPPNIQVNYMGELSFVQVQEKIANYHALFLPTLNENFGHSIVESLLSGCVVICSDQTPWNDLEKINAGFAINLNNKASFINALISLANENQFNFNNRSDSAINYISKKLNATNNLAKYITMFNETIKN
jgi:glycosyltransferase involved in cell wall biosynthesis